MTTYVLVHGGGHGGWCYKKVKRILEAAGHEVFAPSLTGLAERSHLRHHRPSTLTFTSTTSCRSCTIGICAMWCSPATATAGW